MMMRRAVWWLFPAVATVAAVGCAESAGGSHDGGLVFGAQSDRCAPTRLTNEVADETMMQTGSGCFLEEVAAGRAVVWDVVVATVEGDPIVHRYDFDGTAITITVDNRRDEFGVPSVSAERCEGVEATGHLPVGTGCTDVEADGFADDGL